MSKAKSPTSPKKKRWYKKFFKKPTVVPVIRLKGIISPQQSTFGPRGISLANTAGMIEKAFETKGAKAIAIIINSPGGSPTQSNLIHNRIRTLAEEKKLKVYIFCEDAAASGGYYIACAGDEIYADPCSIIGSIGVISAGFGFVEAIKKLGVERRVYTAGTNKSTLDPFKPEKKADIDRLKELQLDIHETFKSVVEKSRGKKLTKPLDKIATGEFWTGGKALELGLVDGISDVRTKMIEIFGKGVELKLIEPDRGLFGRPKPGTGIHMFDELKAGLSADALLDALNKRALWERLGL